MDKVAGEQDARGPVGPGLAPGDGLLAGGTCPPPPATVPGQARRHPCHFLALEKAPHVPPHLG